MTPSNRTTKVPQVLIAALSVACAVQLTGCATDDVEDLDPAGTLAGEEMWDEGPSPAEESSDANLDDTDVIFAPGQFQLPFPCGQVWAGQTRTSHSPQNAIDFNRSNDTGDTVVAAKAGRITVVGNTGSSSYGKWIEISHGGGVTTRYAHLSRQSVSVGQQVSQGQKIGEVGTTGGSTGPHLHYEVRRNGSAIRAGFDGRDALYFGTRNYTSQNRCGGGGGGGGGGNGHVGRVNTAGAPLTVRAGASTNSAAVGSVSDGATVRISCQKRGESVRGTYGTSTLWDKIGDGRFIADAYVSTGSDGQIAPTCN